MKQTPEFHRLQRSQLDAKLANPELRALQEPRSGWIRTIRSALGMSADQLGKRLNMTRQGVIDLERRELEGTVSIGTLRKAAEALNSDLIIAIAPKGSLEETVRRQAERKATEERNRLLHTMRLESQESGVADALDLEKGIQSWLTQRAKRLWD